MSAARPWGVVLCGGSHARLGRDKVSLRLGGRTLLELALGRLQGLVEGVVLAGRAPAAEAAARGVPPVLRLKAAALEAPPAVASGGAFPPLKTLPAADLFPGRGPLAGIHAGLRAAPAPRCLVLACDLPFVPREVLALLLRLAEGLAGRADVVVPRPGEFYEPLCAVYSRACLEPMEAELSGPRASRVTSFYPRVRVRAVGRRELEACGDLDLMFFNLNTPADLERARSLARAGQPPGLAPRGGA